uniref:Chromosome X open reading frame 38 n=1 Tax=Lepisosteus oculatus TaxID=7918 RepID=W5M2X7_LEPOC
MVHEELSARLNDIGYKNWLKAGYCLLKLRDGLHGFVNNETKTFHGRLIDKNPVLRRGYTCRHGCRPTGNQLHSVCGLCEEWKKEILRHHSYRAAIINWGNCKPWLWPAQHWEVAKAYMPRGQAASAGPGQCDAAALLNLLGCCDHFSFLDQQQVREVSRAFTCSNVLSHFLGVSLISSFFRAHMHKQHSLMHGIHSTESIPLAFDKISHILAVDWSVQIPGADSTDGPEGVFPELGHVSLAETELLRESVKEVLLYSGEVNPLSEQQNLEGLQRLRDFLQSHRDLEERFQAEVQDLQSLELELQKPGDKDSEDNRAKEAG